MNTNLEMKVLDAGGRYGIHPTWKLFTGELNYHLFEPDPIESARLTKKYEHRPLEVKVIDQAVAEKNGRLTIHFFRNRAMSSSSVRNQVSPLFKRGMREAEVEVVESIETNAVSIDSYCVNNRLSLKWQPGQSLSDHQETFFAIFGENMKVMNEFMESDELNPD